MNQIPAALPSSEWKDPYSIPEKGSYIIGEFKQIKGKRISKRQREFILFEDDKKLLISIEMLGNSAFLCAVMDHVSMMKYSEKSPLFVSIDGSSVNTS